MKWIEVPSPPALELTEGERTTFEGCDEQFFTRATNGALAGHHSDRNGKPPPHLAGVLNKVLRTTLILASGESTARFELDPGEKFRWIKPSPSGSAFLVFFNTKRERYWVGQGHAVEYAVDGTQRIAITATEPCRQNPSLWDVAYAGDDDLMVALLNQDKGFLLLLARDPATGDFFEVDNIAAPKGVSLAHSNGVVVVSRLGLSSLFYFGVVGQRLVKIRGPQAPDSQGSLQATFGADGAEARMIGTEAEYMLDTAGGLKKASATPRADGVYLRRVTGDTPAFLSPQEAKELFQRCYESTYLRDAARVSFRTPDGRVGAYIRGRVDGNYLREHLLFGPEGEIVFHEKDSTQRWLAAHPTDERALVAEGESLFEIDLRTQERVSLGAKPAKVGYLLLDGHERILTLDKNTLKVTVWAHEALQPFDDVPLAEYDCGEVPSWSVHLFGYDALLQPTPTDGGTEYHLVRIVESNGVTFVPSSGPLRLPGERFDVSARWGTHTIDGVGYIVSDGHWFVL